MPPASASGKYSNITIEMTAHGRHLDEHNPVKIYDERQLEARRVIADPNGKLVYAGTGSQVDSGDSTLIYVMDKHGNFYVDEPEPGSIHHSSLAGGNDPAAAGHIQVILGQVTEMNETSGHYGQNQNPGTVYIARDELTSQGVDTAWTTAIPYDQI